MKITRVIIEGFHNVDKKTYDLSDINYLHGKNGAGKSTVLQAIQLGLLGYVPGTNKTKQGVFTHANNHTMAVKLFLSDNNVPVGTIQRVWNKSKNTVTESVDVEPVTLDIKSLISDVELPLFNFDEFSHMTANTLKDWFINYLPKSTFTTDWLTVLTDAVKELPESTIDKQLIDDAVLAISRFNTEGVEEVRQANAYFKNELSFMKSELARKTSTMQSLVYYEDYTPTHGERELKQLISDIEATIVDAKLAMQEDCRRQKLVQELSELESTAGEAVDLNSQISELTAKYEALTNSTTRMQAKVTDLLLERNQNQKIIDAGSTCTFTHKPCEEIASIRQTYLDRQKALEPELDEMNKKLNTTLAEARKLVSQISSLTAKQAEAEYVANRIAKLRDELSLFNDIEVPNVELLQNQLEEYKEMYGKAVANRKYQELSDVVLNDKYRIENAIESIKLWVKLTDVNGLQAKSGDFNPFEILANEINTTLKQIFQEDSICCKFNSEGKANSFSFGLERRGVYVPYTLLSSGEKCMFLLSMFVGLSRYNPSPLKLILIDDFLDHLDDSNFSSLFESLNQTSGIQYIFAGVKPLDSSICNLIEL